MQKQEHSKEKTKIVDKTLFSDMEDFPFTSIFEFLPGHIQNEVKTIYYTHKMP